MSTNKKYLITTPIYYASGALHIGHCYTSILADACARFKRMDGYDVFFLTGSDEHGLKIARNAEKAGMNSPYDFTTKMVEGFKHTFSKLNITYDKFIRTTDKEHIEAVTKVLNILKEKGEIYKGSYEGLYCVPCESYFTEGQLVGGNCPDCGRPVEKTKEDCYFLKLSAYQNFLAKALTSNNSFLTPTERKTEIYKNFVEGGVQDLCISRSTFTWGIPLPWENKHVVYVWLDALLNYITALGYLSKDDSLFKKYWPADVQFVGRDIARFHAIIWPSVLESLGVAQPKRLHSHGFITLKGDKISKSKSNGFDPISLCDRYGPDAIRYYLLKDGPINYDVPFGYDAFLNTINSDLCNDLGNLVSRTLAMITQYFGGVVPKPGPLNEDDNLLVSLCNPLLSKLRTYIDNEEKTDAAMREIMAIVDSANKYIDKCMPWVLVKTDEGKERLKTVMYMLYETLRVVAVALKGFLSELPDKILEKLGLNQNKQTFKSIEKFDLENFGNTVVKGDALFKRLDVKKELEFLDGEKMSTPEIKKEEVKKEETENAKFIGIEDFIKVQLKVGTILQSEKVEGSDKLLKNTVKIGAETRTILSGIAKYYNPQDLVGKQVVVVTNLAPRKMRGIESQGMILCAVDESTDTLKLVSPENKIEDGSEVC